jgi:hypothetical protein
MPKNRVVRHQGEATLLELETWLGVLGGLLGGLALSIVGNMLTPFFSALLASKWAAFKLRRVDKAVVRFRYVEEHREKGTLIYYVIRHVSGVLAFLITLYASFICVFVAAFAIIGHDITLQSVEYKPFLSGLLGGLLFSVILWNVLMGVVRLLAQASEPEKYEVTLIEYLTKIDSTFDPSRLKSIAK